MNKQLKFALLFLIFGLLAGFLASQILVRQPSATDKMPALKKEKEETVEKAAEKNIFVSAPIASETVGNPLIVEGRARVLENTVSLRVRDGAGNILAEDHIMADAPDIGKFGDFRAELFLRSPQTKEGNAEVYWASPKDGSELDLTVIPIIFSEERSAFKVYFSHPSVANDCGVLPVSRKMIKTTALGRAALSELLRGPTQREVGAGFLSVIPQGTRLKSLAIQNGVARAEFSPELELGVGGSCAVRAIREQITNTLMQFSSVKEVVISIDGRTEDILQP